MPTVVSPGDWLPEGETPARRNAVASALEPPLEEVWDYNAGAGFGGASPLLLGQTVIVATRKGEVHAIERESGRRLGLSEFGEAVEGTPVVSDGMIYVPVGWGGRAIQAYDLAQARSRWKLRTAPVEAGLLLAGDLLVAADVEGAVNAYAKSSGDVVWTYRTRGQAGFEASPLLADAQRVIVADDAGRVAALDRSDGSIYWTVDLPAPVYATPAAGDGLVYVSTTRGRLHALDAANGETRWAFASPDTTVYLTAPALSGDQLVVGASDGVLRSFDARTGALRWSRSRDGAVAAPPLLTQQTIYVGTMNNRLIAVDRATGEVRWTGEVDGRIKSPMAVKDGFLVVLAEPRTVHLFKHAASEYASTE